MEARNSYVVTGYPFSTGRRATTSTNGVPYQLRPATRAEQRITNLICCALCLGVAVIIGYLLFYYISYNHTYPNIKVDSFVVSLSRPLNASDVATPPTITDMDIGFVMKNPNRFGDVYYDHIKVSVYHTTELIMRTMISPFDQRAKNKTLVKASSSVIKMPSHWASISMAEDMRNGYLDLNVHLVSTMISSNMSWLDGYSDMNAFCTQIRVGYSSDPTSRTWMMLNRSRKCQVSRN